MYIMQHWRKHKDTEFPLKDSGMTICGDFISCQFNFEMVNNNYRLSLIYLI